MPATAGAEPVSRRKASGRPIRFMTGPWRGGPWRRIGSRGGALRVRYIIPRRTGLSYAPRGPLPPVMISPHPDQVLLLVAVRIRQLHAGAAGEEPFDQDSLRVRRVRSHVGDLQVVIEDPVDLLFAL